jgi:hypothetical protein
MKLDVLKRRRLDVVLELHHPLAACTQLVQVVVGGALGG